jgi:ABC-type amino acid transport substrate-binding protein
MLIHDAPIILYLASVNESKGVTPLFSLFTEEYLAWAMRKDDTELLKSANTYLQTIHKNGRLKEMIKRWIPLAQQ